MNTNYNIIQPVRNKMDNLKKDLEKKVKGKVTWYYDTQLRVYVVNIVFTHNQEIIEIALSEKEIIYLIQQGLNDKTYNIIKRKIELAYFK